MKKKAPTPTMSPGKPPATLPSASGVLAPPSSPRVRVFISYRRLDSGPAAEHLHASLSAALGPAAVFRDVATLRPGEDYAAKIEQSIRSSTVLLALIGSSWLTTTDSAGHRRIDAPGDLVRLEIETALKNAVPIVPVLIDGANMPSAEELPPSISLISALNAYEIPWHTGVAALQTRIEEYETERAGRLERERAERERLNLYRERKFVPSATEPFSNILQAMESSLLRAGYTVSLESNDLKRSMRKLTGRSLAAGFVFDDLIYVIDFMGVKAKKSSKRFVARSYPLKGLSDVPLHLALERPILVGMTVYDAWFRGDAATTGQIDLKDLGFVQGGTVGVITAWDPVTRNMDVLTHWPEAGDRGVVTFGYEAAEKFINTELRSIEAVRMACSFSSR